MDSVKGSGRTLQNITCATVLIVLIGWLLVIGQGLLIPIIVALIIVYIIAALDQQLGRLPGARHLPAWVRGIVLLLLFIAVLAAFASLITVTVQQLVTQAPAYQANLEKLFAEVSQLVGVQKVPDWGTIQRTLLGQINIQAWLSSAASQLSSAGGTLFLIIIYISFLFGEKAAFASKLKVAFPDPVRAARTQGLITAINERVGQYLGTKTLVNVILGAISYAIMLAFGLDYAAFWALLIGLLNYIPYIGSIVALLLPVALSIVQFGSWPQTIGLFAGLLVAQLMVGNVLEPKMVGRKVNLSPFTVLVALSFWSLVWGITGAILAVPLTSILAIIFNEIPATRPIAVLMSDDVGVFREAFRGKRSLATEQEESGDEADTEKGTL